MLMRLDRLNLISESLKSNRGSGAARFSGATLFMTTGVEGAASVCVWGDGSPAAGGEACPAAEAAIANASIATGKWCRVTVISSGLPISAVPLAIEDD